MCADLNLDAVKETATLCRNVERPSSFTVAAHPVDVRDEASVNGLITQVANTYGRIDVLVNTAGVSGFYS